MDTEMQQAILLKLEALAAKLGVAVEQLWEILVQGQRVSSGVDIIIGVYLLLPVVFLYKLAVWGFQEGVKTNTKYNDDNIFVAQLVGCLVGGAMLIFSSAFVFSGLKGVLAPEYYAFQELLRLLN